MLKIENPTLEGLIDENREKTVALHHSYSGGMACAVVSISMNFTMDDQILFSTFEKGTDEYLSQLGWLLRHREEVECLAINLFATPDLRYAPSGFDENFVGYEMVEVKETYRALTGPYAKTGACGYVVTDDSGRLTVFFTKESAHLVSRDATGGLMMTVPRRNFRTIGYVRPRAVSSV